MGLLEILLNNLAALVSLFAVLWLVSLWAKDASIVDIAWGPSFAVVAWLTLAVAKPATWKAGLVVGLVTLWALRLAGYLAWRNLGHGEDARYRAMREKHGNRFPLVSLVTVFLLQAGIAWVVSWPVQAGVAMGETLTPINFIGMLLFTAGLIFESLGDYQMARFKSDPDNKGSVMNRGLWRYTRHPNYFGDFLVWWGLYSVTLEMSYGWWTIIGPAVMTILLIRVSGVRHLESSLRSRIDGYEAYIRCTSPFIPMPPKC